MPTFAAVIVSPHLFGVENDCSHVREDSTDYFELIIIYGARSRETVAPFLFLCILINYRVETLIGSFAPKIGLRRELTDPDEVKTTDVLFEGIEYKSVKEYEKSVLSNLRGFRRANNPNVQQLMADEDHLNKALQANLERYHGYVTARSFAHSANITYYSARKQLDKWCEGDNPRLLKTKQGQEYIYTEI